MPDFKQHLLKENHGSMTPARLLFYDCETKWITKGEFDYHTMYMGWTYYVRKDLHEDLSGGSWVFHDNQEGFNRYVDTLYQEKTNLYIIGHNIFFDLQASGFFHYFALWDYKLNFIYDSGLTYLLVIKKERFTIKIVSTTNYFAESLDRMGEAFGIRKSVVNFQSSSFDEVKEYCRQDVRILIETMKYWFEFIKLHNCGSFGMTRAAQAFKAYRHRFMPQGLCIHENAEVIDLERQAYMGGRTEAFYLGNVKADKIFCYDVNSMYPSIMRNNDFPFQLIDYIKYPYLYQLPFLVDKFAVVAEICVDTDESCYAVRYENKLIFPVGIFKCFVTTEGLKYAIDHGHLKQCYQVSVYRKMNLFKEYVDYFYKLKVDAKKSGDKPTEKMVKIFLNSLYGKFGQKKREQIIDTDNTGTEYFRIDNLDIDTGKWSTETHMFGSILREGDEINGDNSLVAIAAHITECARFKLHRAIKQLPNQSVLYVDTDSLYLANVKGVDRLKNIDQHELGAWGLEKTVGKMTIYGCKDYVADDDVKIKGVPKTAKEIKPGVFEYTQFLGQASHMRAGEVERFITKRTVKTNKREYTKGTVLKSGYVKPFTFVGSEIFDDSV